MKFLNILLIAALLCAAPAESRFPSIIQRIRDLLAAGQNALNRQIVNFFERERENFPCGWPSLGIPPIDPLVMGDIEANIDTISTLSSISFNLTDGRLRGLQMFDIINFDFRLFRPSLNFEIVLKQLVLDGQHSTRARLGILPISGSGPMTMVLNDVRIKGSFEINTIKGNYLNIEKIFFEAIVGSINADIRGFGQILDPTINVLLSNALAPLINESQDRINELISYRVVPALNSVLNQFRLIDLIIAIITRSESPFESTCYAMV